MDAGDAATLLDAIASTDGAGTVAVARFWLDRRPESFRALRVAGTGDLVGIFASLDLAGFDPLECAVDPVVAAAWAHCRVTAELRAGETLRIVRFAVGFRVPDPGPAAGLLGLRVLAELVRAPAWSCVSVSDAVSAGTPAGTSDAAQWQPLVGAGVLRPVRDRALLARDGRTMSADAFWERIDRRPGVAGPASVPGAGPTRLVLGRPEFDTAVRDLLRWWRRPDQLGANPLLGTRLVGDRLEPAEVGQEAIEPGGEIIALHRPAHQHRGRQRR
jgi:hypothetical protein